MDITVEINLVIEEHHNWLYAWNKDTNEFLGQADTVQGLFKRIAEDIPDTEICGIKCAKDDGGLILQAWARRELEELGKSKDKTLDIEVE